ARSRLICRHASTRGQAEFQPSPEPRTLSAALGADGIRSMPSAWSSRPNYSIAPVAPKSSSVPQEPVHAPDWLACSEPESECRSYRMLKSDIDPEIWDRSTQAN